MEGPTFKTKIEYCGIPKGAVVQGIVIHMHGGGGDYVGVAYVNQPSSHKKWSPNADYPPSMDGGWWYRPHQLVPLNDEAVDFLQTHLAALDAAREGR